MPHLAPPRPVPRLRALPVLAALALLTGCAANPTRTTGTSPATPQTATLRGIVHGGQQIVAGAHIYVFAANNTTYGDSSLSLLNPALPGIYTDALGAYVLTDQYGDFDLSGAYSCIPGQQVYVLAQGGNPGLPNGTENAALAMIAILGACPSDGTFAGHIAYLNINEVSTVASVYSLAGFMTDVTHLSAAGTPGALRGLANATAAFFSLVDLPTGTPRATTADGGSGVNPATKINTLADVIAPCINSNGAALVCTALFNAAPDAAGNIPTETTTALLNIAHNPSANVATLWNIASSTPPFQPTLPIAPNDWTLAIPFRTLDMQGPYYPAIDSVGNLWVPSYATNKLYEFDPLGNNLSGPTGFAATSLTQPYAVAIDSGDNALVVNFGVTSSSATRFSPGGIASSTPFPCPGECFFPAIDTSGNLWISGKSATVALTSAGAALGSFPATAFNSGISIDSSGSAWTLGPAGALYRLTLPSALTSFTRSSAYTGGDTNPTAFDSAGNLWFASLKNNALGKSAPNGAPVSPAAGYTGGGLSSPAGLAIDGADHIWVTNRAANTLSEFRDDGTPITPASALTDASLSGPRGIAIDASGNIWVTNFTSNSVTEFLGAAAPTATPITPTNHGQHP